MRTPNPTYQELERILRATQGSIEAVKHAFPRFDMECTTVDSRFPSGTCLLVACRYRHLDIARWLIQAGANIHATSTFGTNVLHAFCTMNRRTPTPETRRADRALLVYLLSFKRVRDIVNKSTNGQTTPKVPFLMEENVELVKLLVIAGARASIRCASGYTKLMYAASCGDLDMLRYLCHHLGPSAVNSTPSINTRVRPDNKYAGATALCIACSSASASFECIEMLLDHGASVTLSAKKNNQSPLSGALIFHGLKTIKLLVAKGASLGASHGDRQPAALHTFLCANSTDAIGNPLRTDEEREKILDWLLSKKAVRDTINVCDTDGNMAIVFARSVSIMQKLIRAGADILKKHPKNGSTLLMEMCSKPLKYNPLEIVQFLLPFIDNINYRVRREDTNTASAQSAGATALFFAAETCNTDVVALLLDNGADAAIFTEEGKSPFLQAALCSNVTTVKLLLANGCDITATVDENTVLHYACTDQIKPTRGPNIQTDMVAFLLTHAKVRSMVNTRNKEGQHPLSLVRNVAVARLLVEAGAAVDAVDPRGYTALMCAIRNGFIPMVNFLIPLVDDINAVARTRRREEWDIGTTYRFKCMSVLHVAAKEADVSMVRLLLANGASVHTKSATDRTALHFAAEFNTLDVVRTLVHAGASVFANTKYDNSPMYLAEYREGAEVADIINFLRIEKTSKMLLNHAKPWRPTLHSRNVPELRAGVRTVHMLASARPRMSMAALCSFRTTGKLPPRFPHAGFHLLPPELLQYVYTFLTCPPYHPEWIKSSPFWPKSDSDSGGVSFGSLFTDSDNDFGESDSDL